MKKSITIVLFAFISSLLVLSSCSKPSRNVKIVEPLKNQVYSQASMAEFSAPNVLSDKNDFIFKGSIMKVNEVEVSWIDNENIAHGPDYLSVCEVKIDEILYGSMDGIDDSIRVVSGVSSRSICPSCFPLTEGGDYYFITHIFDDEDKTRHLNSSNMLQEYLLGDVYLAGTHYGLFPIKNGKVEFQGWPLNNANALDVSNGSESNPEGDIFAVETRSFEEQFKQIINVNKKEN